MGVPFGYKIVCIQTDQYYIGIRTAKDCHPSDLWSSYFTSSAYVKKLIEQYGTESFTHEVLATFESVEDCINWELIVLQTHMDCKLCLNKGFGPSMLIDDDVRAKMSASHIGMTWPDETKAKLSETKKSQWAQPEYRSKMKTSLIGRSWKLRPELVDKVAKNLTPEHRLLGTLACKDSVWITNGSKSKRIKADQPIPEGWKKGRR